MVTEAKIPSDDTLARTPARALTFLLAVGRTAAIWAKLATKGYTAEEHAAGWTKLLAVDPSNARASEGAASTDPAVVEAFAKLDRWDNDNLPIADVALSKRAPKAHALIFANGLAPADGAESVRVVKTFLDRVDTVESLTAPPPKRASKSAESPDAAPLSPDEARTALEVLTARGITAAERRAARALLATLQGGVGERPAVPAAGAAVTADAQHAAQVALYQWFDEWSTIARRVISRRDQLIALGLAGKKKPRSATGAKKPGEKKPDEK